MRTYPLRLPDHVMAQARAAAEEDGISINHLLTALVADGLGHRRGLAAIRDRAARGDVAAAIEILDRAPDSPPAKGDEPIQSARYSTPSAG
ncbi:MAG TPA: hypothetical protein VMP03_09790 [Methylomirabilota bacterium]|nr:hypothetical protein [Methylomirabilota bacterium]